MNIVDSSYGDQEEGKEDEVVDKKKKRHRRY